MITDMGFELGWFNPFIIEKLVDQIVQEFHLDPAKLFWIEHYSSDYRELNAADFSQVTVEWRNGKAVNPKWTSITPEAVQTLISEDLQCLSGSSSSFIRPSKAAKAVRS